MQCVLVPHNALLDVGLCVREALCLTGVTAEEPVAALDDRQRVSDMLARLTNIDF